MAHPWVQYNPMFCLGTAYKHRLYIRWQHFCHKTVWYMSRNLVRQISRDLHSNGFAMVLTAGFYSDSWAHNVQKVRVVKCIVVYGQIKAADQKYCHNQNKLSNKRFWRQFRWFLAEILKSEGLGFKPCNRSVFINRINSKFFKRGKEEYAFSVDKKTHDIQRS